ncbi:MAG: DUF721 domain-containing protein [Actinophytocola sp.]|nr:DUF721 domain-containing protein [Actinophytocola sp.]
MLQGNDPPNRGGTHSNARTGPPIRSTEGNTADPATAPNEQSGSGRDLARAALRTAQQKAAARGNEPGVRRRTGPSGQGAGFRAKRRRWSGAGSDDRDPQPLGKVASSLVRKQGWDTKLTSGKVFGEWARLVGEELAEHAQPVALHDGELTVRATSTAWATQLRLLQGQLIAKIAAGVGSGVVKRIKIQGPSKPSWRYGPRHVSGRGPRDTYG